MLLFHYTNDKGYKAISSQRVWVFKASKPPGDHVKAAYFTTLPPGTRNLAKRLFVRGAVEKVAFVFCFSGGEDLQPLPGGRGMFVFYSEEDYAVVEQRQVYDGSTSEAREGMT